MRVWGGLFVVALVAGCATPREACINSATRDVRRAQSRVAELERDLARGYIEVDEDVTRRYWGWCEVPGGVEDWQPDDGYADHGWPNKDGRLYAEPKQSQRPLPQRPLRRSPVQERCLIEEDYTVTRRERVDRGAARRELAALQQQISQGTRAMRAAVDQCRVNFPE